MNADHREAMNLYATRLLGAEAADWRCTGCDPDGIDMQAGNATLRLDFPQRIATPAALRQTLKQLAEQARLQQVLEHKTGTRRNKPNIDGIGLASPAFISIRSPDRGRKAILRVTATTGALGGIRAGDTRVRGGSSCKRRACITVPSAPTNSA